MTSGATVIRPAGTASTSFMRHNVTPIKTAAPARIRSGLHGQRPHIHFSPHVLKRFLLRSLVLAGLLLACFAHLIWIGWHATEIVGENIPHPRLSSGYRDIDL